MSRCALILSDLHLGRPRWSAGRAAALRPLWRDGEAAEVGHVIINGDVAEVHHPKHMAAAAREVLALSELCEADGVRLTLLSGNHDPYLTDLRHLHLAHGRVFVTHGDVLHPAVAPWSPAAGRVRAAHEQAIEQLAVEHRDELEARLSVSQFAAHAEWDAVSGEAADSSLRGMLMRPWSIAQVLRYWRIMPRLAVAFLEQHAPSARFIVIGHSHRPGVWARRGRVVMNTGSFGFPGTPRGVVVDDVAGTISMHRIRLCRGEYRMAADPQAGYSLQESADAPSARNTLDAAGRPSTAAM